LNWLIISTFLLALIISVILIIINTLIRKKTSIDREKPSPFECGFDPKRSARLPFSLRFYIIAVVFLVFDVEITLILPIPIILNYFNLETILIIASTFILILIIGLYLEWINGALDWK